MTNMLAFHVGSNVPGYRPEGDVTCWDTTAEARDALWARMTEHVDHLGHLCDHSECLCEASDESECVCEFECDDCFAYDQADRITNETFRDHPAGDWWNDGHTVYLPSGRELPLAFWIEPVTMDHATECEPLSD